MTGAIVQDEHERGKKEEGKASCKRLYKYSGGRRCCTLDLDIPGSTSRATGPVSHDLRGVQTVVLNLSENVKPERQVGAVTPNAR